jgi:AAA domain
VTRKVLCSQGPPGTGKTTTIMHFVAAALKVLPPKTQLLAVSASNVAVDNLMTGFLALGLKTVRVGRDIKVRVTLSAVSHNSHPFECCCELPASPGCWVSHR